MVRHKFVSVAALMDADERGEIDDSTLDDELWFFLIERISTPRDADRFAKPVLLYYAFDAEDIGELFEQFSESKLALLDVRLEGTGWEADERRLQYVRGHR